MWTDKSGLLFTTLHAVVGLILVSWVELPFAAELKIPLKESKTAARKFLAPEEAFGLFVKENGNQGSTLHFKIAPGYYIYKTKIGVKPLNKKVVLLDLQLPVGEFKQDEFFGGSEIFRKNMGFTPKFSTSYFEKYFEAQVSYQGCAEDGICYPPMNRMVFLKSISSNDSQAEKQSSVTGMIVKQLYQKSFFYVLFVFFCFGLLLSFTPCVLPMIPILSGIIVGQTYSGDRIKSVQLSIFYVLGMASMYSLIGIAAGFLGYSFHLSFQKPIVLVLFSLVFVILACSMFGLLRFQVPSFISRRLDRVSRKQTSGTYFGVFIMGLLSALIAGPCLAPPLAAAMTFISQTGSPGTGGAALFLMGIGMGVPLIVIGTSAGIILPRVGAWMERINQFFGLIFLDVALVFFERVQNANVVLYLWLPLLVVFVVWFVLMINKIDSISLPPPLKWLVVLGSLLMCGLVVHLYLGDSLKIFPTKGSATSEENKVRYRSVSDLNALQAAIDASLGTNQVVIVDVYADWCVECRHLEEKTFEQPLVRNWLNDNQLLRFDVTENDRVHKTFLSHFMLYGPPAVLFFKDGEEIKAARTIGFVDANEFLEIIEQVEQD